MMNEIMDGLVCKVMSAAVLAFAGVAFAAAPAGGGPKAQVNFRFLAMADTHFHSREKHAPCLKRFKEFLADVKPLGSDFAVILGDVCGEDQPALAQAGKVAEDSGFQVHFVRGNHDRVEPFVKAFEDLNFSFEHKGWRFVSIDIGVRHKAMAPHMSKIPTGKPIICWRHYGPERPELEALRARDVRLFMSGHIHGHRTGMLGKLRDVNLRPFGAGFAVVDVMKDGRTSVEWRPHQVSKRLVIVHPAEGAAVTTGKNRLLVTAFDSYRDVVKVEFNSGAGWKPMQKSTRRAWTAEADLRGGRLEIRVKDSAGEEWKAAGKYTAGAGKVAVRLGTDWPVPGGTPDNQRRSASKLAPPLRLVWHAQVGGRVSQPVLAGGRLYVTVANQGFEAGNALVCLEATSGRELWRAPLVGCSRCAPAVAEGVVGIMDHYGRAYGFDAKTGKELWCAKGIAGTYATYNLSGGITAMGGTFLVGNLHALSAVNGKPLWKASVAQVASHPVAASNGKLLGAGIGGQKCLSVKDGTTIWESKRSSYRASMFIGPLAVIGARKVVKAADGSAAGRLLLGGRGPDCALSADGKLLVGVKGKRLYAQELAGEKFRWQWSLPGGNGASDVTASAGFAWLCTEDGFLRAVSIADGKEAWKRPLGAPMSGPIVSGNLLFVAGDDGCVYALGAAWSRAP